MGKTRKTLKKQEKVTSKNHFKGFSRHFFTFYILCITIFSFFLLVNPLSALLWTDSDGMNHYWAFEESSGDASDSHGGKTLTAVNVEYSVTGKVNDAFNYNGVNGSLSVGNIPTLEGTDANYTINLWFNFSDAGGTGAYVIYSYSADTTLQANQDTYLVFNDDTKNLSFTGGVDEKGINITDFDDGSFHMVTIVKNATAFKFYRDGTLNKTWSIAGNAFGGSEDFRIGHGMNVKYFNGAVDEFGIWNSSLSDEDVSRLYNSGNGLGYGEGVLDVTLNSPSNNTETLNDPVFFNASVTPFTATSVFSLTNATLEVYDISGVIVNQTTNSMSGDIEASTFWNIYNVRVGNYTWNVYGCSANSTTTECAYDTYNYTLIVPNYIENSQTYNSTTSEGASENFELNVSYNQISFTNIEGILWYNGTSYTGTKTDNGNSTYFIRTINVPVVPAGVDLTFFWELRLSNSTGTFSFNFTSQNQTVGILNIDDCSTYTEEILNFSLKDEVTQVPIVGATYNTTVEVDLQIYATDGTTLLINYSQNYSENNNPRVCLESINTSYIMDVQVYYDGDGYAGEFYHIQESSLDNTTINNINLFNLEDSRATQFLITYKDENFLPVGDALIDVQRKYVSDGIFKSVEIPQTDQDGQATASFELEGVIYTIIVTKEGTVLATFDNIAIYCDDRVIEDCRINLNALSTGIPFTNWTTRGGVTFTETFDADTRTITNIFTSTDGTSVTAILNSTKYDRFGNESVCSDTLTSSSGTLTCVIPESYGNLTVKTEFTVDGNLISVNFYSIIPSAADRFGDNGAAMFLLLMLILPFMFVTSTIGVVFGIILGLIVGSVLMLITNNLMIGAGSMLIFLMVAGGILIYKISRRG